MLAQTSALAQIDELGEPTGQWKDIPVGGVCTVIEQGKPIRVKRIENQGWYGNGYYNARKLDGRKGRTFVYRDVRVWGMPQ